MSSTYLIVLYRKMGLHFSTKLTIVNLILGHNEISVCCTIHWFYMHKWSEDDNIIGRNMWQHFMMQLAVSEA